MVHREERSHEESRVESLEHGGWILTGNLPHAPGQCLAPRRRRPARILSGRCDEIEIPALSTRRQRRYLYFSFLDRLAPTLRVSTINSQNQPHGGSKLSLSNCAG